MRKIIFIISIMAINGCATLSKKQYVNRIEARGYYFVVQINEIKNDTITFETIQIYSPSPILRTSKSDSTIVELAKMPLKRFYNGIIKGVKKKSLSKVILLYTKPEWIDNNYLILFEKIDNTELIDLSKMYQLGE